ncbi:glucan biosynthesis protein [Glaciecola sp. 1036]|uniref:glucan biosynthesis protein n=1 Tax=Alteromonadaceae TaxID=72275 RepID=UPI003CFC881B
MSNKPFLITVSAFIVGILSILYAIDVQSAFLNRGAGQLQAQVSQKQPTTVAEVSENDKQESPKRPTHAFDRAWLESHAKTLSEKAYEAKTIPADNPLSQLNYDDYKKIQFERGATIWNREDRNFRVNPLHPGFLFKTPVNLNLVVGGVSRRVLYTSEIFNYDEGQEQVKNTKAQGYSGFSVTTPINRDDKWDEFMVFQGGTYFRAVGKTNWYGLSARGLAINTGKPTGEEFPEFTDFWIERPRETDDALVVHALMESPSVTGAFTFTAKPGEHTRIKVKSTLYPRTDITHFGIAPLTSMFLFNAMNNVRFDDFRPSVHDSDGLLMLKGNGEQVWRSLANPLRLEVSVFQDHNIKGFGLMQRSRDFEDFEDFEAHYQDRPSAWVTPLNDWGQGHVELFEIPTNMEIHDNIVAFWQPKQPLKAGESYEFNYEIAFGSDAPVKNKIAKVVASASGLSIGSNTQREFVIDYKADQIPEDVVVNAQSSTGRITGTVSKVVPQTGNLRVVVKFEPGDEDLSEIRVGLQQNDKQWGETWLYRWTR